MNKKIKIAALSLFVALTAGCASQQSMKDQKAEYAQEVDSAAPEWFLNPPNNPTGIYGAGTAYSEDIQFAVDKAKMHALEAIASTYAQKVSSVKSSSTTEYKGSENSFSGKDSKTIDIIVESADLTGAIIKESTSVSEKAGRRVYILAYLPNDELNHIRQQKNKALNTEVIDQQHESSHVNLVNRINKDYVNENKIDQ